MKYLCFVSGVLLIALSLLAWIFCGLKNGDQGGGYVFVGIAGAFITVRGISLHEKEMK